MTSRWPFQSGDHVNFRLSVTLGRAKLKGETFGARSAPAQRRAVCRSATHQNRNGRPTIDQVPVHGSPLTEVEFFHHRSRTAIFVDLIQNLPRDWFTGWRAVAARIDGICSPSPGAPREWQAMFLDRQAARASVERILAWPIERVLIAHGEPGDHGRRDIRAARRHLATWTRARTSETAGVSRQVAVMRSASALFVDSVLRPPDRIAVSGCRGHESAAQKPCAGLRECRQDYVNMIRGRRHQLIVGRVALSSGFENAFGEVSFCGRIGNVQRYLGHDILENVPHDLNKRRIELWHDLTPWRPERPSGQRFFNRIEQTRKVLTIMSQSRGLHGACGAWLAADAIRCSLRYLMTQQPKAFRCSIGCSAKYAEAAASSTARVRRIGAANYLDAVAPELKEALTALAKFSSKCCSKIGSALETTARTVGLFAVDFSDWNLLITFS
jgi:hypothetical protein